jgi:hypothetical protein
MNLKIFIGCELLIHLRFFEYSKTFFLQTMYTSIPDFPQKGKKVRPSGILSSISSCHLFMKKFLFRQKLGVKVNAGLKANFIQLFVGIVDIVPRCDLPSISGLIVLRC